MRTIIAASLLVPLWFSLVAAETEAETETYTIEFSKTRSISFGFPRTWTKSESSISLPPGAGSREEIRVVPDLKAVLSAPAPKHSILTVFSSPFAAREAAQRFQKQRGGELEQAKAKLGARGYVVASEGDFFTPEKLAVVRINYFFPGVRIEIVIEAHDNGQREELQRILLETLKYSNG